MNTSILGRSALVSSRLAYGCMRVSGTMDRAQLTPEREAAGRAGILAAYEAGDTHADMDDASGSGYPDGGVAIEDLLYFLARYEAGC